MDKIKEEVKIISDYFRQKNITLATAESCTGGNIAHNITLLAGSSEYFKGGVVSYANEIKINVLKVDSDTLNKNGAVSQPVVEQMAKGVCRLMNVDYGVATSGVAGPGGGTADKPVGTVWIAVSNGKDVVSKKFLFGTEREENIEKSTLNAIFMLKEFVKK